MESKQLKSSEEEIDLLFYFGKFREGLNKVKDLLLRFLRILWKNIFIFLLILLLGIGASFSLRYFIPSSYQTNGLFISHYLPANYYGLMVHDIDQLLDKKNLPTVAGQLHISPEVASKIIRIKLKPLRDTLLDRNNTIFSPFQVTVLLRDMNGLENIQDGLIAYLEGGKKDSAQGLVGELGKIEVVQPFLRRHRPNHPDFNRILIYGFLLSLIIAITLTPLLGRRV